MDGILSLPDIEHLRLRIEPDSELVMGELPREADTLTHSFELIYRDDAEFQLGELTITASLQRVYDELQRRVGFILATQFLIIFVVSILILWIFRHLVTRHLADMADYTRDLSLRNLARPHCLAMQVVACRAAPGLQVHPPGRSTLEPELGWQLTALDGLGCRRIT